MSQIERYDARHRPSRGWEPGPYGSPDRRDGSAGRREDPDRDDSRSGGRSARPARAGRPRGGVKATLGWWMYEWGSHDARFGLTAVAGCAASGAIGTMLTGAAPGGLLGFFVVLGTVTACLAVSPRVTYLIIPSPVLAYLAAAMLTGVVDDGVGGASKTMYVIRALQWIAGGFVAMIIATLCAIGIAGTRWWLAIRRGR